MGFENITNVRGGCMMKDYKYYVGEFLKTLSKMCLSPDDYENPKLTTKVHNRAVDQYRIIKAVLEENHELAEKVYSELMEINDVKVQFYAAAHCLELNINTARAEEILENIERTGEKWAVMFAERNLKIWRGEINPDDPW